MEKLKLDDFINYTFLSGIKFSNNGEYACFIKHNTDLEDNKYLSNLWIYNVSEDKYFKLTSFNEESDFIWLDDNEHILFPATRDKKDKERKKEGEEFTQYYKININGGEAVKAFKIPRSVTGINPINGSKYLISASYNSYNKELDGLTEDEKEKELKRRKEEKDYEVIDEIPFWGNGRGFTNKVRNRLYIYNSKDNSINEITDKYTGVGSVNLNEDKTKAIFIASRYKNKMELTDDMYIYHIDKDKLQNISPYDNFSYSYANFIENNIIFTGSDMKGYGINENEKFYRLDLSNKEVECITKDFDRSLWNSVGSDCRYGGSQVRKVDNGYLYFTTTEGYMSYLNRININGDIERVIDNNGTVDGFDVVDGNIIYIGFNGTNLQEIYSKDKKVTDFNDGIINNKNIIKPEKVTVENDGVSIDGWILRPIDFDKNKKYPAILDIHGGPKTVYGEIFYHEMQYWANKGYVVFFCNPRGSDGKGNEFADIRGKYGTIDYDDIMKFTDYILDNYKFIDKDNVGVTGGSYGGFMTNWIIGHTDRFKAAASQRSISNWISKFCTTDIGYYFVHDQGGSTPWEDQQKLWEHSPLKYADKVKTPTLFIHSEEDYRCWSPEGFQMFTALKYFGVESRLCLFKGENHELSRSGKPKHRIRRLKEITDWFNRYLKNQ